ncbi:PAS domain S-box protein [Flavobacterium sp. ACAM 123]|jgi:PAS domain S-box-containing protein|uniref:PAS domain S-box protein n=1 Tax=Flavobacterium sp. ACAM 123 TaxID=1189620 RepID=UPI00030C846F|nr:PAS domain S-box protein [Flavobacterium sp. ACAM 123]
MNKKFPQSTHEDLLKIIANQEEQINKLSEGGNTLASFEFYLKESEDFLCIAGTDGFYKEVNPAFSKKTGYTKKELLSTSLLSFIHPEDIVKTNIEIERLFNGQTSTSFENRYIKKNGEVLIIQWNSSFEPTGKLIYGIGRDVSQMREAQLKIVTNERLLNDAQKIAKIGSWEFDVINKKMIWSEELYSIYEVKKNSKEKLFQSYLKRFSKKAIAVFENKIKQCFLDKKPFEIEEAAHFSSNRIKWLNVVVIPVTDINGKVIALQGNTQDVSLKREIEETLKAKEQIEIILNAKLIEEESNSKFRSYIDNAPEGVFVVDEKGNYLEVNAAASFITGFSKEELLVMKFGDLSTPESRKNTIKQFKTLQETGSLKGELETVHKSGEIVNVSVDAVRLSESRFLTFVKDITESKKAKKLLTNTFERITDAFVALDTNWCYTYLNKKAGEIYNRNPEDMIGKNIWKEYPQAINLPFFTACQHSIEQQQYIYIEEYDAPSGLWFEDQIYPSADGLSIFFRDISEKKNAEAIIEKSEKYFRALVENNQGIITVIDAAYKVIFRSASSARVTGYSNAEFDVIKGEDYYHPDYLEYVYNKIQESIKKPNIPIPALFQVKHRDGRYIWLEGVLNNRLDDPSIAGIITNFRDITEKIASELKLKQREQRFQALVENNEGIISLVNIEKKSIFRSASSERITGWTDEEFDSIPENEFIHPDCMAHWQQTRQKILISPGLPVPVLFRVKHKKGHYIWLEGILNNMLHDNNLQAVVVNLREVTERIEANNTLTKERDVFAKVAATSPGLIYSMRQNKDGSLSYPYASDAITAVYGFNHAEIENDANKIFALIHPEDVDAVIEKVKTSKAKLVPLKGRYRYFHPSKGLVWHEVNSLPVVELEGTVICHGIVTDITERIEEEHKLLKVNRLYSFISQINQLIVRATNEETLFKEACTIALEVGKFEMAWIGLIDSKTDEVVPVMISGADKGYFSNIKTISTNNDILQGRGPAGIAIRGKKHVVCNDIENDSIMAPWREEALRRGYQSLIVVPIKKLGKVIGVFAFYANEKNFFDAEEIALLVEATDDVSFALEVFEKEIQNKKAEEAVFQSEKRYHTLTEVSPVGIFRTDAAGSTTYVNPSWCQISGLSFQEAMGKGWLNAVHDEDKTQIIDVWENAITTNKKSLSEYRFIRSDGTVAWVMGQAIPERNSENKIVGYVGTVTDITERKQAEDRIFKETLLSETIIKNLPGIFYLCDESGKAVKWNEKFELVLGYNDQEIRQMNPVDYFDEDQKNVIRKKINTIFKKGHAPIEIELYTKTKNKILYYISAIAIEYEGRKCLLAMGLDLTDRKKAEEEIKKANERFEIISSATNDVLFELDFVSGKSWHNKVFYDNLNSNDNNLSNEEHKLLWRSKLHPDDSNRVIESIEECYSGVSNSWSDEFRYLRSDGIYGNFYERAIIIRDDQGKPTRFIGSMLDITDLKKAEEEFKNTNKKMQAIIDALPDLMIEVGLDGTIYNYHSHRKDSYMEYGDQVIGKKISEILPADAANLAFSAIQEAAEKGFSTGRQYTLERHNGLRWFELSIAPMKETEEHDTHFICLSRDITKVKLVDESLAKSEERYRGLLDNLDAGVVVHAADTSVIMSNHKASELLGLSPEQIFGKKAIDPIWKYLNEDNSIIDVEKHPINLILKTKVAVKNFTLGINHPDSDKRVWVLVNGFPVLDLKGEIAEIVISFIDITERKVMEIELLKSKEESEAANKAKTDFLANMSHEIRTPLNGIIGFTHLLMKSELEKNQSEYMSTINESATSLMHIVNDILDFSKIESGKLELNVEAVNLYELTRQVIDLFRHQAKQKNIDLVLNLSDDVPKYILADSVRLKQVLVNLLSNALKFTSFGEIRLDINKIAVINKKNITLKFSVKDTGVGIKLDNKEKIFSSFVQEDNSTNRRFGGTGLGLAISNQLLALMDSKLQLISMHGDGSDFFFEIKFEKFKTKNKIASEDISISETNVIQSISDKKVLIVEDNKINMLLAKTLVRKIILNCTIYQAMDGNEAVECFKKEKPDVILMDIQMPNKNGYEATHEIRKLAGGSTVPIIAITAGIMTGDKEKCLEEGLDDYLSKPIIEFDLEQILMKWLKK